LTAIEVAFPETAVWRF